MVPILTEAKGALPTVEPTADLAGLPSGCAWGARLGESHHCRLNSFEPPCYVGVLLVWEGAVFSFVGHAEAALTSPSALSPSGETYGV